MTSFPVQFDLAPMSLSGMCRFYASRGDLEVELVEVDTLARSVVYLQQDADLVVFVPKGTYGFLLRRLSGDGSLHVRGMSFFEQASFWLSKALNVLRRGPLHGFSVLRAFLRRRGQLTAAQTKPLERPAQYGSFSRPGERPAELTRPLGVSIIIPTKVHSDLLRSCLSSLDLLEGVRTELIIVDNGATSEDMLRLLDDVRKRPNAQVLRLEIDFNFSRLCNAGARLAQHEFLLFLNDDIEATDGDWLSHMLAFGIKPDVGVVGARLLYPSGLLQHAGIASNLVPGPGHPFRLAPPDIWSREPLLAEAGEVDAVTGACLLIRTELFNALGGFNETDFGISLNDVDLCLRAREIGLKVVYVPQATLVHKESQSRRRDDHPKEHARRQAELAAFLRLHSTHARESIFYPKVFRRDSSCGIPSII